MSEKTVPRQARRGVRRRHRIVTLAMSPLIVLCMAAAGAGQQDFVPSTDGYVLSSSFPPAPARLSTHKRKLRPLPTAVINEITFHQQVISDVLGRTTDRWVGAIPYAMQVLALRVRYQGDTWWETVDARLMLEGLQRWSQMSMNERRQLISAERLTYDVHELVMRHERDKSIALLRSVMTTERNILGDNNLWYAHNLMRLASLYDSDDKQAELLLRQALQIVGRTLGAEHPGYAASLDRLRQLLLRTKRYAEAGAVEREMLAIRTRTLGEPSREDEAAWWRNPTSFLTPNRFGFPSIDATTFVGTEPLFSLYRDALKLQKAALGDDGQEYATGLDALGVAYLDRARYGEAEPLFRQALQIRQRTIGKQHLDYATSLNNLGVVFMHTQRYAAAEPLFRESGEIRRRALGERHPDYAESLYNRASAYRGMPQPERAEPLYRKALAIRARALGVDHPLYADTLGQLGGLLAISGRPREAATWLLASARANWTRAMQSVGPIDAAKEWRSVNPVRFRQDGLLRSDLLSTLCLEVKAIDCRIALHGVLLTKQVRFELLRHKARTYRAAGAAGSAEWQRSWAALQKMRRKFAHGSLLKALGGREVDVVDPTVAVFREETDEDFVASLHMDEVAQEIEVLERRLRPSSAVYAADQSVGETTLRDISRALRSDEALVEYTTYSPYDFANQKSGRSRYAAFVLRGDTGEVEAVDLGETVAIDRRVDGVRATIRDFIDQWSNLTPSDKAVQGSEDALGEESAEVRALMWSPLETYLTGVRRVYVAPDGELGLLSFETLAETTAEGRWRYLVEDRELVYVGTGRDLSAFALNPSGSSTMSTAVLVGDPNFDADPRDVAADVAGVPRPTDSVMSASRPDQPGSLGPVSGGARRLTVPHTWGRILSSGRLITGAKAALERLGWSVDLLTRDNAIEDAVAAVAAPTLLQFVTHGYVLDQPDAFAGAMRAAGWGGSFSLSSFLVDPMLRSMLILTGANNAESTTEFYRVGADIVTAEQALGRGLSEEQLMPAAVDVGDGLLTAFEVTGMNLHGTQLVNLTACETGLGEVTLSGVEGLRQAFFVAGARSLTMSMWEVPTGETIRQIEDFYTRWLSRSMAATDRYAAFRGAQLAALARAREARGSGYPYYWAGSVYVGDPGDLPSHVSRDRR